MPVFLIGLDPDHIARADDLHGAAEALQTGLRNRYGSPDYIRLNENMRRTFVKVISLDLRDRLPSVRQPTLLIWGGADTETPLWMARVMEKNIPDAGLVIFEGGDHFAYLKQAPRFCLIARHFLSEE